MSTAPKSSQQLSRIVPDEELAKANTSKQCWLSVHGIIYDVTPVLDWHPGGDQIILAQAGKRDATQAFLKYHSETILTNLLGDKRIVGKVDPIERKVEQTSSTSSREQNSSITTEQKQQRTFIPWVSVQDAEEEAKLRVPETSFAYFATGAEDEITLRANEAVFRKYCWFRPRVLRDVASIDTSCVCFGKRVSSPIFVTSTAIQGLADPTLGELAAFRAARQLNMIHIAAHLSSRPWEDYLEGLSLQNLLGDGKEDHRGTIVLEGVSRSKNHEENPDSPRFLQLYLPRDKQELARLLKQAETCKFEALFITVDSPSIGKRERDVRTRQRIASALLNTAAGEAVQASGTAPRSTTSSRWNESFNWEALTELMRSTSLPIVLKGIQRGDDAVRAVLAGVQGIMVSNHGGRNLDSARPSLACLVEITTALRKAGLYGRVPIFFDGGVRRGGDVLKALCLGADFVGVGRPILYGVAARGQAGAREVLQILQSELVTAMKIVGCTNVKQAEDSLVEFGVSYL